ncbi:MAG: transposase [Deltaproteobacteria bacterium]|nr:transposase [Deltaproteobacteria bacterium]MBW2026211.1 transposase [Deltaproteobacteria bacterium]MBW2125238.1 transposase [Deltaproteobacteria bacterium]
MARGRITKEKQAALKAKARPLLLDGVPLSKVARRLGISYNTASAWKRELEQELEKVGLASGADFEKRIYLDLDLTRTRLNEELVKKNADSLLIQRLTDRESLLRAQLSACKINSEETYLCQDDFLAIAKGDVTKAEDIKQQLADIIAGLTLENLPKLLKKHHWAKYLKNQ